MTTLFLKGNVNWRKHPQPQPPGPLPPPNPPPPPPPGPPSQPTLTATPSDTTFRQAGSLDYAYWTEDNRWGQGSIVEDTYSGPNVGFGTNPARFNQGVGIQPVTQADSGTACRLRWRWPLPAPAGTEVKGFPAIIYGQKPGFQSSSNLAGGDHPVILPNGAFSQVAPSGKTPGSFLPLQLPLASLKIDVTTTNLISTTGKGHVAFDCWCQSNPNQYHGFTASPITHEIMITLNRWGGYGYPPDANESFYDHNVTIGGNSYRVYCNKDGSGNLGYTFGSLNNAFGRSGWKFIRFTPDSPPINGTIDFAAFVAHVASRTDASGTPWMVGNEYLVDIEFGVEPIEGVGDILIWPFRVYT